jgi:hypothetical protein
LLIELLCYLPSSAGSSGCSTSPAAFFMFLNVSQGRNAIYLNSESTITDICHRK